MLVPVVSHGWAPPPCSGAQARVAIFRARRLGGRGQRQRAPACNLRSLLARETLEDDLGVAVDAEILDGRRIAGARGAVAPLDELLQQRSRGPRLPRESLHSVWVCATNAGRQAREERGGGGGQGERMEETANGRRGCVLEVVFRQSRAFNRGGIQRPSVISRAATLSKIDSSSRQRPHPTGVSLRSRSLAVAPAIGNCGGSVFPSLGECWAPGATAARASRAPYFYLILSEGADCDKIRSRGPHLYCVITPGLTLVKLSTPVYKWGSFVTFVPRDLEATTSSEWRG